MKNRKYTRNIIFLLLIPLGLLLTKITSLNSVYTEKWYSQGINLYMRKILSGISGILPFSLSEILVAALIIFIVYKFIVFLRKIIKNKNERLRETGRMFLGLIMLAGTLYFLYVFLWGLNYGREPFSVTAGLNIEKASSEELAAMCEDIIQRTNSLREKVSEDKEGVMKPDVGRRELLRRAYLGFEVLGEKYPALAGKYGNPKPLIFSELMSYQGLTGVYSPFTAEANVNINEPIFMLPATAAHEMAHQRGFAREDEANYIAYLACSLHPDIEFQYSGLVLSLIHSMNALYANDYDRFSELYDKYSDGLLRDLKFKREYWKKYEGIIEKVTDKVNDTYLKANRQQDGIKSYGRMVDLLLAEYRIKES